MEHYKLDAYESKTQVMLQDAENVLQEVSADIFFVPHGYDRMYNYNFFDKAERAQSTFYILQDIIQLKQDINAIILDILASEECVIQENPFASTIKQFSDLKASLDVTKHKIFECPLSSFVDQVIKT